MEDLNAATLVTSGGIFSSGTDIGAGTAEYVGVSLPFTVKMILSLPGTRRENAFSLSCEDADDSKRILTEDNDEDGRDEVTDDNSATSLARRVGISTPPLPPSPDVNLFPNGASRIATTPPRDFFLGPPKVTRTGSSVPVQRVTSLLLPGASSVRSGGIAAGMAGAVPKSLVIGSFAARGRSDAGFYSAIAAKVRGERMERRSTADVDDALGNLGIYSERSNVMNGEQKGYRL